VDCVAEGENKLEARSSKLKAQRKKARGAWQQAPRAF
jgi:hypothetical protein